jgi:NAD(P)H-hydrate epimerase
MNTNYINFLDRDLIKGLIPRRESNSHKDDFGRLLVIAGSYMYPGAAILSSRAAYRVGTGVVSIIADKYLESIYASNFNEATYFPLEKRGSISEYEKFLDSNISRYSTILIGPGLGVDDNAFDLIYFLIKYLKDKSVNILIDADGLVNISKISRWWEYLSDSTVITPHIGEFKKLLGYDFDIEDSIKIVKEKSDEWGCSIVLKNSKTIIAKNSVDIFINNNENSLLSTAGTGDILSGIIAGLIAQGVNTFDASCVGVYIHSMVGMKLKERFSDRGMLSSDMLDEIPIVIKDLLKEH